MTISDETIEQYILDRTLGYSIRAAAADAGIATSTAALMEQKLKNYLEKARADVLNDLYDRYALHKLYLIERTAQKLEILETELENRLNGKHELVGISTADLFKYSRLYLNDLNYMCPDLDESHQNALETLTDESLIQLLENALKVPEGATKSQMMKFLLGNGTNSEQMKEQLLEAGVPQY